MGKGRIILYPCDHRSIIRLIPKRGPVELRTGKGTAWKAVRSIPQKRMTFKSDPPRPAVSGDTGSPEVPPGERRRFRLGSSPRFPDGSPCPAYLDRLLLSIGSPY
jgi:hypothetical protein